MVRIVGVGVRAVDGEQRLDLYLGSEDRLDAVFGAGLGKANGAVEAVVVGEGQGRLSQSGSAGDQLFDPAPAVEEREVRMHVEVYERVERARGVGHGGCVGEGVGCGGG